MIIYAVNMSIALSHTVIYETRTPSILSAGVQRSERKKR
jgi:hypothetical protein